MSRPNDARLEGSTVRVVMEFAGAPEDDFFLHEWRLTMRVDYPVERHEEHLLASGRCDYRTGFGDTVNEAIAALHTKTRTIVDFIETVAAIDTDEAERSCQQAPMDRPVC